jgi:hypothetical protein
MNVARYNKNRDVFLLKEDEKYQISNMDIIVRERVIKHCRVLSIVFGWTSEDNPLYKIKKNTP